MLSVTIKFLHMTPTANIEIHLRHSLVSSQSLNKYENKQLFDHLCKIGCPNYDNKWSCPPNSPNYIKYSQDFKYCLLLLMTCELSQLDYVKTEYMKVKASNAILKSKSDNLARYLETTFSGKMLSNGSCRLCKPCTKKTSTNNCKHPSKLRYSLESLGLNVEEISSDFFNHKLCWYKNKISPPYSSVISGLLINESQEKMRLSRILNHFFTQIID